jgi:hypothetical protein
VSLFLKFRRGYFNLDHVASAIHGDAGCLIAFQSGDHYFVTGRGTETLAKLVKLREGVTHRRNQEEKVSWDESLDDVQLVEKINDHECLIHYGGSDSTLVSAGIATLIEELDGCCTVDPNGDYLAWDLSPAV